MMVSPVEHQMTVESPTNGQPPAPLTQRSAIACPQFEQREMDHLRADGATFGSVVCTPTPTWPSNGRIPSPTGAGSPRADNSSWTEIKLAAVREAPALSNELINAVVARSDP